MKKTLLLCLSLAMLFTFTAQAQKTASSKARVAQIRKMYADAKERIMHNDNGDAPRSDMEVTACYVIPAAGSTKETIHYYYELQNDGEDGVAFYQPYFVTRNFNIAARNFYQEFLFDTERRELVFCYGSEENFDGGTDEVRFYWGDTGRGETGLVHKIIKGKPETDDSLMLKKASDLRDALNSILNQNY